MSTITIRNIPPRLVRRVKARASETGTTLDAILSDCLQSYADGTDRAAAGRKGGAARAEALSPERRKEIAKKGAQARWHSQQKG